MSDITINNEENQDENQKMTPVTESSFESNSSSIHSPGDVLQIWLCMWVKYKNETNETQHDRNATSTPSPTFSVKLGRYHFLEVRLLQRDLLGSDNHQIYAVAQLRRYHAQQPQDHEL